VSVTLVLGLYAVGAAAIALWLVVRFPSICPRSVTTAIVAGVAAAAGLQLALVLIDPVAHRGPYGVVVALMLVVLPALTAMFWTLAVMMRLLAALRP
jgi:hypothetical protein